MMARKRAEIPRAATATSSEHLELRRAIWANGARINHRDVLSVTCRMREVETPDVVGNLVQGRAVGAGGCPGDVRGSLRYFKRLGLFFKPLGLFNAMGENQPSSRRRFQLFPVPG